MDHLVISPKKLIEVALPLDSINEASAKEKGNPFLKGHPRNLHQWWARRPLAAARAVIFSQLVHDPEDLWRHQNPGCQPNSQIKGHWTKGRSRLFAIIEDLVKWENTSNEIVLERAREEIRKSWRETCELNKDHPEAAKLFNLDNMPGLHDPFAGGGAIPLEAQRLGLDAYASDLNPVAVLLNKAMIELPPKYSSKSPAWPNVGGEKKGLELELDDAWSGASGLAEDLRRSGKWIRDEAKKRIGHLYPDVEITKKFIADRPDLQKYLGKKLATTAWLWARTVKSPNPAFSHLDVPLANTFMLSTKPGKEAYIDTVVEKDAYKFVVRVGKPDDIEIAKHGTSAGRWNAFRCLMSGTPITYDYIRGEGVAHRMGIRLMAIVAEGYRERIFLSPTSEMESIAKQAQSEWSPELDINYHPRDIKTQIYGLMKYGDLFMSRQLLALSTLCDLITEARKLVLSSINAHNSEERRSDGNDSGADAKSYADALATYLSLALDKSVDYCNSICAWNPTNQNISHLFTKQAIPMTWDFVEMDPISGALPFDSICDGLAKAIELLPAKKSGLAFQANCGSEGTIVPNMIVSTDPPYYDNIGYADLSDFFYVWLRKSLRDIYPSLFSTISVPKDDELVATPYRHGSPEKAEKFFLDGMTQAMSNIALYAHPSAPITIYYAFKQSETKAKQETSSPGWDTFLEAVLRSGLAVTGTWPMRTERAERSGSQGNNSLASSIILVCRPRAKNAAIVSRRQFIRELNESLPLALDTMTRESEGLHSPVAPVDLSQAIIGPGMAIFSRYAAVLEANGSPMTVRTALQLINRFLAEDDFDSDTQFCLHWFEQCGWESGKFGEADTLARAKGTSVDGVKNSGVLHSAGGNVSLLRWAEYPTEWDPKSDQRLPIWEVLHQLIRVFNTDGETGAAAVFDAVQSKAEAARQLAYRLYTLCERKNWAEDARGYNEVVTSWSGIESAAAKEPTNTQRMLFE
jgi:putative DNA methylase